MVAAATIQSSQAQVLAGISEAAQQARVSQVSVLSATEGNGVQSSQAVVLAAVRGRTDDPAVRAWTFTLDGHDMYVLRLGNDKTLVYDISTDSWYHWASGTGELWNIYNGQNWVGGNKFASSAGSNVLIGSDANGSLFFLNPDRSTDESQVDGRDPVPFTRRVTAQIPARGYDRVSVYEVQLVGSSGELEDTSLTDITLSYSDDRGDSYTSAGTVTIPSDDYDARATWRSLGSFRSPGRLFRLEDDGALKRIDSLTMNSDLSDGN